MALPSFETDKVHVTMLDESLIRVFIKSDVELDLNDLDKNYLFFKDQLVDRKGLFLIVFGRGAAMAKGATEKFSEKTRQSIKVKEAFVITTLPHRILGNLYLRVNKPSHPTKFFTTENDAINWLNS